MWTAPARVTFPDGTVIENVVYREYDNEDETVLTIVFASADDVDDVLLETDVRNAYGISTDGDPDLVQVIETGAGDLTVDWSDTAP